MEPLLVTESLRSADVEELARLEGLLFPDVCLNEYSLKLEIDAGQGWALRRGSQIVAYLFGRLGGSVYDILRLGVLPEHQGLGYGTSLLERALAEFEDLMLTVRKSNTRAIHLYQRYNFRVVGELSPDALLGGQGAWVMRRTTAS